MTQHYLILDGSYYCFYRYHALKQWWGFARKDDVLQDNHDAFLEKFREVFVQKLKELPKTLKLKNFTFILGKDCPRKDIWRMQLFPEYKASRDSHTDELLKKCFQLVYSDHLFQEGGIVKTLFHPYLEADDVIALHTKHLREKEPDAFIHIVTSDTDYIQLLQDNVELYTLNKTLLRHSKGFDGNVEKYLFCKCIMGDKSDNIPSAFPKCGPKTAEKCWNEPEFFQEKLKDPRVQQQYELNRTLIDFKHIPSEYTI
jgi:5'-3' exonuclease